MITLYKNIAYKLELVVLDNNGKFTPGLTVTYEIRKCSDNSLFDSGTMSETSSVYYVDVTFTESAEYRIKYVTPTGYENGFTDILVEDYDNYKANVSALALDATVAKEAQATINKDAIIVEIDANEIKIDAIKVEEDLIKIETDKISNLDTQIKRILGLSMENHRIFSPVYDANNCLTSAIIKIYPTKTDVLTDTNSIASYNMIATFDSEGKCLTYRMTKES